MDTPGEGGNSSRETNNAAFETIGARVHQQRLRFEQVQELIERSFDLETHRRAAMQGVSEMLRRLQRVMAEIRRADQRIYRESMVRGGSGGGESAQRRVIMQRVRRTLRRMQRGIDELIREADEQDYLRGMAGGRWGGGASAQGGGGGWPPSTRDCNMIMEE